jgi:dephospho-CoA kinase
MHDSPAESHLVAPFTIVLLGGIASGKSTVAAAFARRGAVILDADRIAHEELATPEVLAFIRENWGDAVFTDGTPSSTVNRKKLAEVVFAKPEQMKKLEALLHPRVLARMAARTRALATPKGAKRNVVVLDVPLAAEVGIARTGDLTVFVDASIEVRARRAREIRGWPEGELERREARQISPAEKKSMADAIVKNDQGVAEADNDVERIWSSRVAGQLQG